MQARPEFLDPEDDPEADERASFLARWAGRQVPAPQMRSVAVDGYSDGFLQQRLRAQPATECSRSLCPCLAQPVHNSHGRDTLGLLREG